MSDNRHSVFPDGWDYALGTVITPTTKILDDEGRDWAWAYAVFRTTDGFPDYQVGTNGTFWSCIGRRGAMVYRSESWRRLKPGIAGCGRAFVELRNRGVFARILLHRLILFTFIGPPNMGQVACHFPDRNPLNNNIYNLRWDSQKGNLADRKIHGTLLIGAKNHNAKIDVESAAKIRRMIDEGLSQRKIARQFGISQGAVYKIKRGETWRHAT